MSRVRKSIALAASAALIASSTAAVAAAPAPQPAQAQTASPWLTLTALGPTRSIALGGAAATAQPTDVPPGPPPPPAGLAGLGLNGEIIGFLVWFALIGIALGNDQKGGSVAPRTPISPV